MLGVVLAATLALLLGLVHVLLELVLQGLVLEAVVATTLALPLVLVHVLLELVL